MDVHNIAQPRVLARRILRPEIAAAGDPEPACRNDLQAKRGGAGSADPAPYSMSGSLPRKWRLHAPASVWFEAGPFDCHLPISGFSDFMACRGQRSFCPALLRRFGIAANSFDVACNAHGRGYDCAVEHGLGMFFRRDDGLIDVGTRGRHTASACPGTYQRGFFICGRRVRIFFMEPTPAVSSARHFSDRFQPGVSRAP